MSSVNITDNIIAQYSVKVKGDKDLLRFLDRAQVKANKLKKTLGSLRIPGMGGGFGGGLGGGGRGGFGPAFGYGFGQGGAAIGRGAGALGSLLGQGVSGLSGLGGGFSGIGSIGAAVGPIMAVVAAVTGLTLAWAKGIQIQAQWMMQLSQSGGVLESMERRIQSISSEFDASPFTKLQAGREKYSELYQIAKMPGIDMPDASTAYTTLKFNEIGDQLAMRLIKGFGNFNAFVGGGTDEFGRIVYALQNIASSKGKGLSGQDLRQLVNANVPIFRIMKDAFGVSDAKGFNESGHSVDEFLEKVTEWLETKVPKAADTAQNAWDNVLQAIERAKGEAGKGLNMGGFTDLLNKVTDAFDHLSDSGVLQSVGSAIMAIWSGLQDTDFENVALDAAALLIQVSAGLKGLGDGLSNVFDTLKYMSPIWLIDQIGGFAGDRETIKKGLQEEMRLQDELRKAKDRQRARHGGKLVSEIAEENRLKALGRLGGGADEDDVLTKISDALEYPTRAAAGSYEMRRAMYGGDDLARMGVTPVELGTGSQRNNRVQVEVKGAGVFQTVIRDLIADAFSQAERQGFLRPVRG